MTAILDALVAETRESALRDERRWGATFREWMRTTNGRTDFVTYDEEIAYMRRWIATRAAHLAAKGP